jgi:ABC-2 type transport system permease protein
MPVVLERFAEHQPLTPIVETMRSLLTGTPVGSNGPIALAWCVALLAAGYTLATWAYRRRPSHE